MPTVYAVDTCIDDLSGTAFQKLEAVSIDIANQKVVLPWEHGNYTHQMEQSYLFTTSGCPIVYVETLDEVVECLVATAHSQLRHSRDRVTFKTLENELSREHIVQWLTKNLDAVRDARVICRT